jgi:ribose transport system ATP-binding protein
MSSLTDQPVLSVSDLSKTFPGQRALDSVDFTLDPGEIRALVGQNGSGKSTFIKTLCGYHQADPGAKATVAGRSFTLGDGRAAFAAGLRFVHQDLALAPTLNALDNLAISRGYYRNRVGTISWRREAVDATQLLNAIGYDFDIHAPVADLTPAERTGIAIARALRDWEESGVRILVLDEPTASLPAPEVDRLFEVIRMVNRRGVAVLYVSHRFGEVFELCETVTVLRDGRIVTTAATASLDLPGLIELTIGRAVTLYEAATAAMPHPAHNRQPALRVRSLRGSVVKNLDFDVQAGEILGVAGVTGSGREEVAGLVFGSSPRAGSVDVAGVEVPAERPDLSYKHGMAIVPADRLAKGALPDMTLRENITLGNLAPLYGVRGLRKEAERREVQGWLTKLEVVPAEPEAHLISLSGGNQQKVMMARALRTHPCALILDEPTQGVDVGAKAAIHRVVKDSANDGAAVLVISTDTEELLAICDRILVLVNGHCLGTFTAESLTEDDLSELTMREDLAS